MDMRLELVPLPVADVDRAKAFYTEKWDSTWITILSSAKACVWCSLRLPGRPAR
jgi:hypothetical protein